VCHEALVQSSHVGQVDFEDLTARVLAADESNLPWAKS
jgi:hypothetical protein